MPLPLGTGVGSQLMLEPDLTALLLHAFKLLCDSSTAQWAQYLDHLGAEVPKTPQIQVSQPMPDSAEDQQPQVKYQRLEADVTAICESDSATFLCVTTKVLALGTLAGSVHILDVTGNEVWTARHLKSLYRVLVTELNA